MFQIGRSRPGFSQLFELADGRRPCDEGGLADDEPRDESTTRRERLDKERERVIQRAVAHSQKLSSGATGTEGIRDSVTSYDLDLLNIAGRFTPQQIIAAFREPPAELAVLLGYAGCGQDAARGAHRR